MYKEIKKGGSVVATILLLHKEESYCSLDLFLTKPTKQFHWARVAFPA